ncbi:ATP-dependent RNA helicase [Galactobacter caseinivorans]|uniref:RNA helicase n=1 Tax=Galactobacter caseinivorans TaxID=2676123 RepID=A0A496PII0_9MICC|nr:ATP-dependent RNA helicase [Galactobacter caseinivorans]
MVQAPPGTGKTTLVPPLLANQQAPGLRTLVTQPRRVAVRSAARRLAQLDGSRLGERVGYSVRGEHHAGPQTQVEFLTPGLLLRRLLADPELTGVGAVVVDEVHERQLDTDLLIGLLMEVRELREDLSLVAMSATLDAPRFAALLGTGSGSDARPAPLVDSPSALHPLQVIWAPGSGPRQDDRGVRREFLHHVAATAALHHGRAVAANPSTDALVFLPGAREVNAVVSELRSLAPGTEILPLHGQIPAQEQDRAVSGRQAGEPARIIVSTALAESSLTVPGVRLVIDAGLSREPRKDAARGMQGLVTVSASRAAAQQRAGRAARLGPGTVVRCYDERTFAAAPEHITPELLAADLTQAALTLAAWGTPRGEGLRLPDAPPAASLREAEATLRSLRAVDDAGRITSFGQLLASLPVEPRWGRALLSGAAWVGAQAAAETVALATSDVRADGADLAAALRDVRSGRARGAEAVRRETQRLKRLAREHARGGMVPGTTRTDGGSGPASTDGDSVPASTDGDPVPVSAADRQATAGTLGAVVALAWPERIARRVADQSYLLASGTRAALPPGSGLSGQEWIAIADVARAAGRVAAGTGAVIRSAAALTEEEARRAAGPLMGQRIVARFEDGRVRARNVSGLGAIEFSSTPVKPSAAAGRVAVAAALRADGLGLLHFGENAGALRRRLAFLHRELGQPWPDVSEAALLDRLDDWLGPELERLAAGTPAHKVDLLDPLRRLLPWPAAARLEELAPQRLSVPSGNTAAIEYPEPGSDGPPVVSVKLQECFGWASTPRLADGRAPILFHLLSPARRPLAVTEDLASFWSGPYQQVRSEMRGRYPKHPWPEDPWTATSTHLTKNRLAGR